MDVDGTTKGFGGGVGKWGEKWETLFLSVHEGTNPAFCLNRFHPAAQGKAGALLHCSLCCSPAPLRFSPMALV